MADTLGVEEIVAKLTEAQRRAVLGKRRLDSGPGMWPLRSSLRELGLIEGFGANPTPLWHAVRAYLQAQTQSGDNP